MNQTLNTELHAQPEFNEIYIVNGNAYTDLGFQDGDILLAIGYDEYREYKKGLKRGQHLVICYDTDHEKSYQDDLITYDPPMDERIIIMAVVLGMERIYNKEDRIRFLREYVRQLHYLGEPIYSQLSTDTSGITPELASIIRAVKLDGYDVYETDIELTAGHLSKKDDVIILSKRMSESAKIEILTLLLDKTREEGEAS